MVSNADDLKARLAASNEMTGPVFKITDDPRVTRAGKWMRRYSLDELPQFYSVLQGNMSLVGRRPPLASEYQRFTGFQKQKLSVKPGMTGLWQVNGRNQVSDFDQWVRLDLDYIRHWSLGLDIRILVRTVVLPVLSGLQSRSPLSFVKSCVFVTGGAGFIGSHLADRFLRDGWAVRILDSLEPRVHPGGLPRYLPAGAEFIRGDVRDRGTLLAALREVDVVSHQAAYQDYMPDFSRFLDVNAVSTALLFELIVGQRLPVKKIIVASSQAVYGEGQYRCLDHGDFQRVPVLPGNCSAGLGLRCPLQRIGSRSAARGAVEQSL